MLRLLSGNKFGPAGLAPSILNFLQRVICTGNLCSNHDTVSCGARSPASVLRIFAIAGFTCDPRLEPDENPANSRLFARFPAKLSLLLLCAGANHAVTGFHLMQIVVLSRRVPPRCHIVFHARRGADVKQTICDSHEACLSLMSSSHRRYT